MAAITLTPLSPCTLDHLVARAQECLQTTSPLAKHDDHPLWMTKAMELNRHRRSTFLDDMRIFGEDSSGTRTVLEIPREMSTSTALSRENMEMQIEMHGEGVLDIYDGDSDNSINTFHEACGKEEQCSTLTAEERRAIVDEANLKIEHILQEQDDLLDWTISSIGVSDPERATTLKEIRNVANGRVPIFLHEQKMPHKRRVLRIKFTRDRDERRTWTLDQRVKRPFTSGANRYAVARRLLERSPGEEEETSDNIEEVSPLPPSKRRRVVPLDVETTPSVTNPWADGSLPQGDLSFSRHQLASPFEPHYTTCFSPRIDKLTASLDKPANEKSVSKETNNTSDTSDTPHLTPAWARQFISSPSLEAKRKSVHWADDSAKKTNVDQKNSVSSLKGRRFSLPRTECLYTRATDKLVLSPTRLTNEIITARNNNSRCSLLPPLNLFAKRERRDSDLGEIADKMYLGQAFATSSCLARITRASAPPPPSRQLAISPPQTSTTISRASTIPASPTKDSFELAGVRIQKNRRSKRVACLQDIEKVYEASAGGQVSDFLKHPTPPHTKNVDKYREMLRERNRKGVSECRWK